MGLTTDLRVLYRLALAPVRGKTHRDRLECFYRHQAGDYDYFRQKLLHGRQELYESLPVPQGGHWVEMGGGTGSNLEFLGSRIDQLESISLVDLSPSLLKQAAVRCHRHGWDHVRIMEEDATKVSLPAADVVTFSYSLTMIPNWFEAIDHAINLLKPGGILGVVDFYVSRKHKVEGLRHHGWPTRTLWPSWFAMDNVMLCADHLHYLRAKLYQVSLVESSGRVPYLPLVRVPHYIFQGCKV